MAAAYTDEEKRTFAKTYAATHNLSEAFKAIRPNASNKVASNSGGRMLDNVGIKELVQQYEKVRDEELRGKTDVRLMEVDARMQELARIASLSLNVPDPQFINAGLKALDILNKMQGNYIEKRQLEVTASLADVLKGVGDDD